MKHVISRSMPITCLLVSGMALSALAQAGTTPSAPAATSAAVPTGAGKIGIINFQACVFQTNEGQRNFGELRKKFEPQQQKLKAQADDIDNLEKQLQTAGDKLSDTERQSRLKSIDEKKKAYQRSGEDVQNDYQQEMGQTYQQLLEKVGKVMVAYATDNGFGVVLDSSAGSQQQLPTVLWASESMDITMPVVQAYNAKSGVPAPPAAVPSAPTPTHTPAAHAPAPK